MLLMLVGVGVLGLSAITFAALLPRNGRLYRLAGTAYEPYVGVAFTAAIALGFTMALSGAINFFGHP